MASPNFRINGGAVGVPASVAAAGAVTATLDSTDGVRQVEWYIASTDETTAIGDYTLVQSGSIGQTVTTTALVAGTAARLRCRINGGVNLSTGLNDPNGTNAHGKFGVLTAAGYMVGCVGETTEQDATSGWAKLINPIIRVAPSAAPVTSVTGTAPIVSSGGTTPAISITAASGGAAGSMSAAHYTLVNDATAAATANTIALRGSSSESAFGYLYSGGSLPTTGFLRHASGFTYIASTTAAGGFDNAGFADDGADGWKVGNDTRAAAVRLSVKTGGSATVEVNNVTEVTMDATGINLASGNTYQVNGVAHATTATNSSLAFRGSSAELAVGYLYSAGTVATTGFVRCTSTATFVAFRDFADTMDIPALHTDGSDRIFLGSGVAACDGVTLDANGATGRHDLSVDGTALLSVGPTESVATTDVTVVGLKTAATGATISGAATLDTTQSTVYVDAAGGSFSLALPAAASVAGRIWTVVKTTAANTVTLDADGTEKINGALTYAITAQWSAITIQAVNKPAISEWIVIATA